MYDGGFLESTEEASYQVGDPDSPNNVNAELNIYGGTVGGGREIPGSLDANSGSVVNIFGGQIESWVSARSGSRVNVYGGDFIGGGVGAQNGAVVDISGDYSMYYIGCAPGGRVHVSSGVAMGDVVIGGLLEVAGGSIGGILHIDSGGQVNLTAGAVGPGAFVSNGAVLTVTGGEVGEGTGLDGTLRLSGGTVGEPVWARSGSVTELRGRAFYLDGELLSLTTGVAHEIHQRDVVLSGVLVDGSPFSFDLNSTVDYGSYQDFFVADATVRVTLVPEPAGVVSIAIALALMVAKRRARH